MEGTTSNSNNERSISNNRIEVPIKKYVPMHEMCRKNADLIKDLVKKQLNQGLRISDSAKLKHPEDEFCIVCICKECLQYRDLIQQVMIDSIKTRDMWKVLQETVRKFYEPIIKKTSSNAAKKLYEDLSNDVKFNWLSKGVLDKTKLQHIDFMSDLALTDNMIFVLLSALLTVDDAHQLFELLCYQIECFARSYAEGLTEKIMTSNEELSAEYILTYILNGYEELNKIAETTSSFLFTFESKYLEQFSLSWSLLNKKMYQKWVHSEFAATMPQCIIKLKDEVDSDRYSTIVKDYISLDEEMMTVDKDFQMVWFALNRFYSFPKEEERQKRLKDIYNLFKGIKNDIVATQRKLEKLIHINEWETHKDRKLVWETMLMYIKERWPSTDEIRFNTKNINHFCKNCDPSGLQILPCNCITCLVIGGPPDLSKISGDSERINELCFRCSLASGKVQIFPPPKYILKRPPCKKLSEIKHPRSLDDDDEDDEDGTDEDELISDSVPDSSTISEKYHLSWAVFKHLKDRKPYPYTTVNEIYFCSSANCNRTCCLLAKKILNNEMAFGLSQYLVNHYQPFSMTHDEMAEMLPNIMLYNRKVISMNLQYDPPSDDIVVKTFWTFIISAFASYFVDAEADSKKPNFNNLKLNNNDIELPMEYIDLNNKAIKFLDFIEKIKSLLQNDTHCQVHSRSAQKDSKAVENGNDCSHEPKKEEKPSVIPPEKPPTKVQHKTNSNEQATKSWEKTFSKALSKHHQCCSDHLEELESCKENHFSKMCFHEKECSHARVNETRDRLRKKLNATKAAIETMSSNPNISRNLVKVKAYNKSVNETTTLTAKENVITGRNNNKNDKKEISVNATQNKTTSNGGNCGNNERREQSAARKVPCCGDKNCSSTLRSLGSNIKTDVKAITSATTTTTTTAVAAATGISTVNSNKSLGDSDLEEWVNDTLNFIEGHNSKDPKKVDRVVNNKKAAKKLKQKQKKEEQKRIEELQELRSQFHELYFKEYIGKTELKTQKCSKKKDKKRITELESSIKKVNKSKLKIEASILELISSVKSINPEFKFSYLPTKEQQQEMLSKAYPEETTSSITPASTGKQQQQQQSLQQQKTCLPTNTMLQQTLQAQQHQLQYPHMQGNLMIQQPFQSSPTYAPPDEFSADSTKRIVTIRRVTLPHATEPQVTVTAKGDSPDKDKLLYTFINGQLVPAASLDSQTLDALQPSSSSSSSPSSTLSEKAQKNKIKNAVNDSSSQQQQDTMTKTKTQLKKERKRAKKLLEQEQEQVVNAVVETNDSLDFKNSRNNNKNMKSVNERSNSNENSATKDKKNKKLDAQTVKGSNNNEGNDIKQMNSKQTQQTKNTNSLSSKGRSEKKTIETSNEVIGNKSGNRNSSKVIDNGQFDNNQFKMLHLDEFVESDDYDSKPATMATNGGITQKTAINNTKTNIPIPAKNKTQQLNNNASTTNNSNNNNNNNKNNNNKKKKNNEKQTQSQITTKTSIISDVGPVKRNSIDQKNPAVITNVKNNQKVPVTGKNNSNAKTSVTATSKKPNNNSSSNPVDQRNSRKPTRTVSNLEPMRNNCNATTDSIARNLHRSLQKLHLNADTTIEPAIRSNAETNNLLNPNISIMEQLNRGVQVEDLTLPPGITLTKVDPSKAEALRAKTESIGKLSQPMQNQPQSNHIPPPMITSSMMSPHHYGNYAASPDQSGVIMVDAMNLKHRTNQNDLILSSADTVENKNKLKRMKRKNKKKKNDGNEIQNQSQQQQQQQQQQQRNVNASFNSNGGGGGGSGKKSNESKMITLRNPMFHNTSTSTAGSNHPVFPIQNKIPIAPLATVDQPAAIIKNENGMFTIRNPALHQAFLNGLQQQTSPVIRQNYNPSFIPSTQSNDNFIGEYSYFSGNSTMQNGYYSNTSDNDDHNKRKCLSAIGSEIKNAQQKKLNNQWQQTAAAAAVNNNGNHYHHAPTQHQTNTPASCYNTQRTACSGYLNQCNDNYHHQSSNYFNGYDVFSSSSSSSHNTVDSLGGGGSLFSNSTHHSCGDDSPPPSVTGFNRYLDGFTSAENDNKYDDVSFLKTLIPGQRLNSEVTIHNINESKFNRNNNISPISHRVEITPISRPSSIPNNNIMSGGGSGTIPATTDIHAGYGDNSLYNKQLLNMNNNKFIDNDTTTNLYNAHYNYGFDSTSSSSSLSNDFKQQQQQQQQQSQQCSPKTTAQYQHNNNKSQRSSPYLNNNETTIDNFVHSMNSLKLSSTTSSSSISDQNGTGGRQATIAGGCGVNISNGRNSWW